MESANHVPAGCTLARVTRENMGDTSDEWFYFLSLQNAEEDGERGYIELDAKVNERLEKLAAEFMHWFWRGSGPNLPFCVDRSGNVCILVDMRGWRAMCCWRVRFDAGPVSERVEACTTMDELRELAPGTVLRSLQGCLYILFWEDGVPHFRDFAVSSSSLMHFYHTRDRRVKPCLRIVHVYSHNDIVLK